MTATDRILSHWKAITPQLDVAMHEAGFRRVIEEAVFQAKVDSVEKWMEMTTVPQSCGDERLE